MNDHERLGTTMKRVICLFLFASLPALADDVSGVWKVNGSIADHTITPTCTLEAGGQADFRKLQVDADHSST